MPNTDIGWDPRYVDVYIDVATKILTLYLFFSALALAYLICRWWIVLRLSSSSHPRRFNEALFAIRESNWPHLRTIARRFYSWSLHGGLRDWAKLPDSAARNDAATVVHHAAARFRLRWLRESTAVDYLGAWMVITRLALAIFSFTEITKFLEQSAWSNSFSRSAAYVTLAQIGHMWIAGLWLILTMYVAHWYFSARLAQLRTVWRRFIGKLGDRR